MLEEIRIQNFAVIEDLDCFFNKGFNVIIGQTGAGKSIIIQALNLISGARSEFSKVRDESKKAFIEAKFSFSDEFISFHPYLKEYLEDGTMIVSRALTPSKSSYQRINGENVSLNELKKIMRDVIDIFSQTESSFLKDSSRYLDLLDSYSPSNKLKEAKKEFALAYKQMKEYELEKKEFDDLNDTQMLDFYQFSYTKLSSLHIQKDEIENLEKKKEEFKQYEKLQECVASIKDLTERQVDLVSLLMRLQQVLKGLDNTSLKDKGEATNQSLNDLLDNLSSLNREFINLDVSQDEIDQVNSRLFLLSDARKKYGRTTQEILSKQEELKTKIDNILHSEQRIKLLEEKIAKAKESCLAKAEELSKNRKLQAEKLERDINKELNDLMLKDGGFKIALSNKELSSSGIDEVSFKVSLNKGLRFEDLAKAASGGENARLNLALKSVFSLANNTDTLVFDEIDTGISGEVAIKAAEKMKEISLRSNVICITHLAQVLALADSGYKVIKQDTDNMTESSIIPLDEEGIVLSMAELTSSSHPGNAAIEAAREMRNSLKNEFHTAK